MCVPFITTKKKHRENHHDSSATHRPPSCVGIGEEEAAGGLQGQPRGETSLGHHVEASGRTAAWYKDTENAGDIKICTYSVYILCIYIYTHIYIYILYMCVYILMYIILYVLYQVLYCIILYYIVLLDLYITMFEIDWTNK